MERTYLIIGESYKSVLRDMESYISRTTELQVQKKGDTLCVGRVDNPRTAILLRAENGLAVTVDEVSPLDKIIQDYSRFQRKPKSGLKLGEAVPL